jgi:4,5-dihydroxyphthalate decarboxylase
MVTCIDSYDSEGMTAPSARLTLTAALGDLRHVAGLKDGSVTIPGVTLQPIDVPDQFDLFRRMARHLEFDIAEMAVVTYLSARRYGVPLSGLPVVLRTLFPHASLRCNVNAGITTPKDLERKRVGTRAYTVTPGVLERGMLSDEFGVDLDSISWVTADAEHVAQYQDHLPPNVVASGEGVDLFPRLESGELDAGITGIDLHRRESPSVQRLFPDALQLDREQYRRTGIVPPYTVVVVKDSVLAANAWLAEALYEAFHTAKAIGTSPNPRVVEIVDGDSLPYGLPANRSAFEQLIRLCREQHILSTSMSVDELFPAFD